MTTENTDHRSTSSRPQAMTSDTHALMSRAPEHDSLHSKPTAAPPEASANQKVVAEAARVLSLLMEFAELERLRQEKDRP